MSKVFTCNTEGFDATRPVLADALERYQKATKTLASELSEVGADSNVDVLIKAAKSIEELTQDTILRNVKNLESTLEQLDINIKKTKELTSAGGAY